MLEKHPPPEYIFGDEDYDPMADAMAIIDSLSDEQYEMFLSAVDSGADMMALVDDIVTGAFMPVLKDAMEETLCLPPLADVSAVLSDELDDDSGPVEPYPHLWHLAAKYESPVLATAREAYLDVATAGSLVLGGREPVPVWEAVPGHRGKGGPGYYVGVPTAGHDLAAFEHLRPDDPGPHPVPVFRHRGGPGEWAAYVGHGLLAYADNPDTAADAARYVWRKGCFRPPDWVKLHQVTRPGRVSKHVFSGSVPRMGRKLPGFQPDGYLAFVAGTFRPGDKSRIRVRLRAREYDKRTEAGKRPQAV